MNPHKACYLLSIQLPILRINLKRRELELAEKRTTGKFSNLGETYFESIFEERQGPVPWTGLRVWIRPKWRIRTLRLKGPRPCKSLASVLLSKSAEREASKPLTRY